MLRNQVFGRLVFRAEHHILARFYYQEKSKGGMIAQFVIK
jgi:hypothetical protein